MKKEDEKLYNYLVEEIKDLQTAVFLIARNTTEGVFDERENKLDLNEIKKLVRCD